MIRRHSLVWLRHPPATSDSPDEAAAWQQAGHPFMVCRTRPNESLSLGFCLPSSDDRNLSPRRIAVSATMEEIATISRPPELRNISEKLGLPISEWEDFKEPPEGCTVRLIGSRMWAVLTGGCYVRSTSDLDLVVDLIDASAADAGAGFLVSASAHFSVPVDGELSFPGLGDVHGKEWLSDSPQVLLKSVDRVALVPRAEFFPAPQPPRLV